MRLLLSSLIAALLMAGLPGLAFADAAGSAKGVKPAAEAALEGATRSLKVGSDIFIGDVVDTGDKGQVQILFADKTELVVGPHSSLEIEDYLIRNDGSAGKLAVDMLAGSFRFATGDAAKNRYTIDTPTGTIGVRGTQFDVYVDADGTTRILLYRGSVQFCSKSKSCEIISDVCKVGEYDPHEARILGDARQVEGDARKQLKREFIYSENQSPLLREFWFANAYDCLHNPPDIKVYPADPDFRGDTPPAPPGRVIVDAPPPDVKPPPRTPRPIPDPRPPVIP